MSELKYLIRNYIKDPKNPLGNFMLGQAYEGMGQTASAASFYIRSAEFGDTSLLKYESMIRTALCLTKQGSRTFVSKGIFLRAISICPERPEAYFLISRIYEQNKDWMEAYTWATMGCNLFKTNEHTVFLELNTDVEYPGAYGFIFEKAVAAWYIGLQEEAIYLFKQLCKKPDMLPSIADAVRNNLKRVWNTWKKPIIYDSSMHEYLRCKFHGSHVIEQNYSQCYQDMFVLTMLNGKKNGVFLEIGHGDPFFGNNTYLLEKDFKWTGISIDKDFKKTEKFKQRRTSFEITGDAVTLNYEKILDLPIYDYLQIDCDPAIVSLNVLKNIPFHIYKFAVITFEHDYYNNDNKMVRDDSRKYLMSLGYKMVVNNIAADEYYSFEDWYVHPDLVDNAIINKMLSISDKPKKADLYMLNKL
jgi:hypothetical protein